MFYINVSCFRDSPPLQLWYFQYKICNFTFYNDFWFLILVLTSNLVVIFIFLPVRHTRLRGKMKDVIFPIY